MTKLEKYDAELVHHEYISILLYLILNLKENESLGKVRFNLTKINTDHYNTNLKTSKSYLISLDSLFDITDENKIGAINNIKNNIIQFLNNVSVIFPANINKEEFKFYLEAMLFYSHKKYYFNYTKFQQRYNQTSEAAKKVFLYIYKKSIDMIREKKDELKKIEENLKIQKEKEKDEKMKEINTKIKKYNNSINHKKSLLKKTINDININYKIKNSVIENIKNLMQEKKNGIFSEYKVNSKEKKGLCKDIRRLKKQHFKRSDHNLERNSNKHPLYGLEKTACRTRGQTYTREYTDNELSNSSENFTEFVKGSYEKNLEDGIINTIKNLKDYIIEEKKMRKKYENEKQKMIKKYENEKQ